MDISKISYNDHTLFHMLRHFECINETARKCLLDRGYSVAAIDANLAMPGSKFHRSFATDIKTLVSQITDKEIKQIDPRGKYVECEFSFSQLEIHNGIGTKAVMTINEIALIDDAIFVEKPNRGIVLKHAYVKTIPNDWRMTIVLKPQKNYDLLITAFPGLPTLPFPKSGMGKVEFELAEKFWREHCFLEF